jgi:hypothetical protein
MDTAISLKNFYNNEEVVKQKFWITLCLSITVHVGIMAFVGLS